jgi:colanic acid/amylovoran biosynthesis glycosyltransferase
VTRGLPSRLILFTTSFPFGRGEEFLEAELPYLASAFDHVAIVPTNLEPPERPIPPNVRVETQQPIGSHASWARASHAIIDCLLSPSFYLEAMKRPKTVRAIRAIAGVHVQARRVERFLRKMEARQTETRDTLFYTYWFNATTLGVARYCASEPVQLVTRAHRGDLYEDRRPAAFFPFREDALAQLSCVYSVSSDGYNHLVSAFPTYVDKILVSRLGVNPAARLAPRSEPGTLRIVSCSYLTTVKRVPLLALGVREFAIQHPELDVLWDHLGDGSEAPHVHEALHGSPRNLRTTLHGHLTNAEVLKHYEHTGADVFVSVSESEGVPVSIMEAQSFAIPVIATAVGGVPEIVSQRNGHLLDRHPSPNALVAAIESFLDRDVAADKARCSLETWRQHFNAQHNYSEFARSLRLTARPWPCRTEHH